MLLLWATACTTYHKNGNITDFGDMFPRIPKNGHRGRVADILKINLNNISTAQGLFESTFRALQVKYEIYFFLQQG